MSFIIDRNFIVRTVVGCAAAAYLIKKYPRGTSLLSLEPVDAVITLAAVALCAYQTYILHQRWSPRTVVAAQAPQTVTTVATERLKKE